MARTEDRRGAIVASAVELLDDDGLDGLSMRRLSERTGASATSVYWYVKSKDELVASALDAVIAEIELPDLAATGWRAAAEELARGFRAMVLRHPWVVLVAATYPTASGRNLAVHDEHLLELYEVAGFTGEAVDLALSTVYAFVIGATIGEAGTRVWRSDGRGDAGEGPVSAASLVPAREAAAGLPRITARLDALEGTDPTAAAADAFEFGLRTTLDGLQAQLTGRSPESGD